MRKILMIMVALLLVGGMVYAEETWLQNIPEKQVQKEGNGPRFNYYSNGNIIGGNILMNVQDEGAYGADFNFLMSLQYPYPPATSFHTWVNFFMVGQDLGFLPPDAYAGTYALTDSPGTDYPTYSNAIAEFFVDLTGAAAPTLSFYTHWEIESGYDYGFLEMYSTYAGTGGYVFDDSPGFNYDLNGYPGESSAIYTGTGINLTGTSPYLTLTYAGDFESSSSYWDGFIVEVSNDGGSSWAQVDSDNSDGNYDSVLSTSFGNPLGGLYAFCYDTGSRTVTFDLSDFGTYTSAQFRFHFGWDDWYGGGAGCQIDYYEVGDSGGPLFTDDCSSSANYTMEMTWAVASSGGGGGTGWYLLAYLTGYQYSWMYVPLNLTGFTGPSWVDFRMWSDYVIEYDGWYIDEVSMDDGATNLFYDGFESGLGQWLIMQWGLTLPIPAVYVADPFDTANTTLTQGEWVVVSPLSGNPFLTHFDAAFDDSAAAVPAGGFPILVDLDYDAFNSAGNEDFVLLYYQVTNTGAEDLEDVYCGMWNNFDMNGSYGNDYHQYHAGCDAFYTWDDTSPLIGGMKYIGYGFNNMVMMPGSLASLNFEYGFSDVQAMTLMTNGEFDNYWDASSGEVFVYSSTGPWDIPAGETLNLCFAMVMGDDLADWEANVNAASAQCASMHQESIIKFDKFPDTLAPIPVGTQLDLLWADWGVVISGFSMNGAAIPGVYAGDVTVPECDDCIPKSAPNFAMTTNINGDSDAGVFTFTFINPYDGSPLTASEVSVFFLDVEELNGIQPLNDSRLVAYDLGGNALATVYVPLGPNGQQFKAEIITPGIHYVKAWVGQPDPGGDSGALDNFRFVFETGCSTLGATHGPARGDRGNDSVAPDPRAFPTSPMGK